MTPQILLDALRKAFLNIEMISFIIMDECHHATGNHPYTKIMKVSLLPSRKWLYSLFYLFFFLLDKIMYPMDCYPLVKEFYHKCTNKPKIFGMTASPVTRKGLIFTSSPWHICMLWMLLKLSYMRFSCIVSIFA